MRLLIALGIFLLIATDSQGQDFSNKGKDFWVGYGYHQIMRSGNNQDMVLYFATEQVSNVTVSIPGLGYSQTYSNIPANTIFTSNPIPKAGTQDARLLNESTAPENKGIHIESDKPIVAYAHIYNSNVSGASILFPTNTLGKEYYSINYTNNSNSSNANCWFYVIACDTGTTTVEIIPSANTLTHSAGVPFTVSLTKGQVYNFLGQLTGNSGGLYTGVDLTGTKIRSISTAAGACKKIAVFSGSGRIGISCNGTGSSSDNYMVQSFPKTAWGKKFLTSPTSGNMSNNIFRICVSDPATQVKLNGANITVPFVNNFYYEIPATASPLLIEANLPITVAQYITSQGNCGNGTPGDPEVIYLSPVEQNINSVIWNATPNFAITQHFFNVIIPNSGTAVSSFRLDGAPVSPLLFKSHPQDPNYVYLAMSVGAGQRRIESDSGFNAIAYGFGSAESYGYNAGTNVKDLLQQVGVSSLYGIEQVPSVCSGSPFKFKVSLPYLADSIRWNLSGLPGSPANITKIYSSPPSPADADSTTLVDGKTVYWYSLVNNYTFNTAGTFPVSLSVFAPNAEGCGNEQLIDFELNIYEPPIANFNLTHNGCINQPVQFNDATTTAKPLYKWYWDFGDPASGAQNTAISQNPTHAFSAPGTYTVKYTNITTPGCLSDTVTRQVVVNPLPVANLTGNITVCQNAPPPSIVFTGTVGTAPFTFTYNINGGPAQTAVTTTGNSVSVPVPTGTTGTFAYQLVSVKDAAGTGGCSRNQADTVRVQVISLPTATIAGNTSVCQNSVSPNITFTGTNAATLPYTFTYNINGGAAQTISTTSGNSVTLPVPTTTAGSVTYNLVSVRDASATACAAAQTGSATINVLALATASISGSASVCQNAASPQVTFTGAGGTAPYTFSYSLNGGTVQTITSSGNAATVSVPTGTPGSFVYQLLSIKDASPSACSQAQTGSATVVVNALPVASFANGAGCVNTNTLFTDQSSTTTGTITTWAWNFGDPGSGAANTSTAQNPAHSFSATGSYPVTLTVTNSNGCVSNTFSKTINVNVNPVAGFTIPQVCLNDVSAMFTDTSKIASPGSISKWLWNFGDPGSGALDSSLLQNGQHKYTATGSFTVKLTVTSADGCSNSLSQSLFINGASPVANFVLSNPTTLCANDSVRITDASVVVPGNITRVEVYWDNIGQPAAFDFDDNPVPGKLYRHKYPNFQSPLTKSYTIRYRAYSGTVCVNDKIQVITINAAPAVQFAAMPDACPDAAPFQITQATETGGVPGTGVYSGPGVSPAGIFDPASVGPGIYRISYKFTSSAGGCIDTTSQLIRVLDAPVASLTASALQCVGSPVTFSPTASTSQGTIASWVWNFGDGSPLFASTSANPVTHTYSQPGNYTVTLQVITSNGCKSTTSAMPVTINGLPLSSFALPANACLPAATVVFTNQSSAGTYLWNFGDPASGAANTSTAVNPTHIYNTAGPFSINLQTTNTAGCKKDTTIVFSSIHPQPVAAFTTDVAAVCVGAGINFTDASNPADGTTTQWAWDLGNTVTNNLPVFNYTYPAAGSYNVSLVITNNFGCSSAPFSRLLVVYAIPTVDAGPTTYVLEGGSVTLEPTVTGTNLSHLWDPATYLSNATIARPVSTPLADIQYRVTVSNPGNCSATDSVMVKVLKGPNIPNTFSPNGDGINEKWIIEFLDTYPNNRVQVFTRAGQLVFESRGYKTPWNGTMNGKTLPIDTYYYIIEPGNGRKPLTGYVTILK